MTNAQKRFDTLKNELISHNFPLVGAVDYDDVAALYLDHGERYRRWIERNFHGEMTYLERGLEKRLNPKLVFPELQSVVVVARPYPVQPVGDSALRYARYLNGEDYHTSIKRDLEQVFSRSDLQYKVCVDTSAVLERSWALLAGIGWIGKNTLLINPHFGSYLFLAVVFTNAKFAQPLKIQKDYCGNCDRCMKACPTSAIVAPRDLDSRKCISYLTLEKRGEWESKVNTAGFVAGCDLCQEICPYNTKPVKYAEESSLAPYLELNLETLKAESEEQYRKRIKGTALERVKYQDFKRNLESINGSL